VDVPINYNDSARLRLGSQAREILDRMSRRLGVARTEAVEISLGLLEAKCARGGGLFEQRPAATLSHLDEALQKLVVFGERREEALAMLTQQLARIERNRALSSLTESSA
jgi:hypothetical protein